MTNKVVAVFALALFFVAVAGATVAVVIAGLLVFRKRNHRAETRLVKKRRS
jgi:NADH:ubiquinone oxidoreductase subunit K